VLVDRYIEVFAQAGIKLLSIRIGVELLLDFVATKPQLQKSTIVLNVLDGQTMLSMVFVGGDNIFMSRTRLYGEDKAQLFNNMLENLSGLIQFVQSQKHGAITESYYLGVSEADIALLKEINPYDDIMIGTLELSKSAVEVPAKAHFAVLNAKSAKGGVDLLEARKLLDAYVKNKQPKKWWIPALVVYVLMFLGATGYLLYEIHNLNQQIKEIEDYINSPYVVQRQAELNELRNETNYYNDIVQQAEERAEWERQMPAATSDILDFIIFGHGTAVTVRSFEFNERSETVRVNAACVDAQIANNYVNALYREGVAENVQYTGYGSDSDGMFTFSVEITLNIEGRD